MRPNKGLNIADAVGSTYCSGEPNRGWLTSNELPMMKGKVGDGDIPIMSCHSSFAISNPMLGKVNTQRVHLDYAS
jgi:hypothetical protein